ncbi:MAG TPA: MFS transporter [Candidatus Saccharimonadales bacterium]|nr:MFS transporter [Candidatus Saccharimonadales bacterium]
MNFLSKLSPARSDEIGRLRRKLYFFSFFDEFILIYPLYTLMFQAHRLTGAQISSLLIVLSATIFVLQVPAGSVADIFSRRFVLTAAVMVRALAFMCWLLFPNYIGFLVGFVLWGVKRAFVSGTMESFVFDELKRLERSREYARVTGHMQTYALFGFILGGFGAGVLAGFGFSLILLCSIAAICVSAGAIYSLPSAPKVKHAKRAPYMQTLKAGVRVTLRNPVVLFIVSIGAVVNGLRVVDEYYGLFFHELRFNNQMVALWIAGIYVFGALGSFIASKMERKLPVSLVLIVWAALLGLATILPASLAPVSLGLFGLMYYAMTVLLNARLQHEISDEVRATATSVTSFVAEFLTLAVYGVFALTSGKGYALGLHIVAISIACFGVVFGIASRIYHKTSVN